MKRMFAVVVVAVAMCVCGSDANAQAFDYGYQFMAGAQGACGYGGYNGVGLGYHQREQPPYFALYPPVYYGQAVKRPYGVSPFAVPGGITPVEMTMQLPVIDPVTKVNPFFNQDNVPVVEEAEEKVDAVADQVTWRSNHFLSGLAAR